MQDLPVPASMLHFGTVPFPLRVLHLNAWIPAFAGRTEMGSSLDMEKPPEEGAQGGFPFRIS